VLGKKKTRKRDNDNINDEMFQRICKYIYVRKIYEQKEVCCIHKSAHYDQPPIFFFDPVSSSPLFPTQNQKKRKGKREKGGLSKLTAKKKK
jgi:hypothetical protein